MKTLRCFVFIFAIYFLIVRALWETNTKYVGTIFNDINFTANSLDLMLSVPYYIYNELDWLAEGSVTTIGNHTFQDWIQLSSEERNLKSKHDDDIKLYLAATKHPMRVLNPEEAKLFFVPSITSLLQIEHIYGVKDFRMCRGNNSTSKKICGRNLMVYIDNLLRDSPWFQRSEGRDHIAFLTYFHWMNPRWDRKSFKYIPNVNVIQFFEDRKKYNSNNRISFGTMYVGRRCPIVPFANKTADFTMIAKLRLGLGKKHDGVMSDRRNVCKWTAGRYIVDICGEGSQCPALGQARLGFHVRGDSISANRLFDTLLSGITK
jgi:hypothetical protein